MFEGAKLNFELLKTKLKQDYYHYQEKRVLLDFLLATKVEAFIMLALLAAATIIADATITIVLLAHGGIELNPLSEMLFHIGFPGLPFLERFFNAQALLAQGIVLGACIYVLGLMLAINSDLDRDWVMKNSELIRKLSKIMLSLFVWIIFIRSFCTVWNWLILGGVAG